MKILILTNFGMGLYNFRKELLEKLIKDNYEVIISMPKDEYYHKLVALGCTVIEQELDRRGTNPITDYRLYKNYKKTLKKYNPSLVLTYTIKPNIYGSLACKKLRIPHIVNVTGLGTFIENGDFKSKLVFKLYKYALNKSNIVYFQNKSNLDFFLKKAKTKENWVLLPGSGVNLQQFEEKPMNENKGTNFLYIGRLMKNKGTNELLDAIEIIGNQNKDVRMHIVGFDEENYTSRIKKLESKHFLIFHGQQKDVKKFIEQADCIIQPSYHEGMSNVLLEGAAMGRPLLASNIPGCKEIVDNGINGYLFEPQNVKSLIETMNKFINDSTTKKALMGKNSRKKVEQEFDRNIIVKSYINNIEKIIGGN